MPALGRSTVTFSVSALLVLLAVDLAMSTLATGGSPLADRGRILLAYTAFHGAALALSFFGAGIGFACVRRRLPSTRQAMFLGAGFGLASLFGGALVALMEGPILAALWFLFGAMAFAIGGSLLSKPWRAEGHT